MLCMQTPDPFTCPFEVNPKNTSEYLVHYNPMATLINPLGEDTISRLFARGVHKEFGYTTLWVLLGWCVFVSHPHQCDAFHHICLCAAVELPIRRMQSSAQTVHDF